MSDEVTFEEEEILVDSASQVSRHSSALTNMIMHTGLAKNESQANYVLIGIMVACLLLTIFVIARYLL